MTRRAQQLTALALSFPLALLAGCEAAPSTATVELTPDTASRGRALLMALSTGEKRVQDLTEDELRLLRTMQAYRENRKNH